MQTRWVAFLRAINVGGHTVQMDTLRQLFEGLGLSGVETFIASGNVVFDAPARPNVQLQDEIEDRLLTALGYAVAVFIRTDVELTAIANSLPFQQEALEAASALNVAFLSNPLDEASRQKLMSLKTEIDDFQTQGREIYWLCRKKQSESTFSNAVLEKTLSRQSTLRGINTIKRMAAKYGAEA